MLNIRHIIGSIDRALEQAEDMRRAKLVIYPYGEIGQMAEKYLKDKYRIAYLIDNKKFDGVHILNLSQAKYKDNTDVYVLICNENPKYFKEIREDIREIFDESRIIDPFPVPAELPDDREIHAVLKQLEINLERVEKEICM